jgi:4-coumarate--CoA ligase
LIYLAIVGAGGRFVGSNPAYTTYELNHLFNISEVKFVMVESGLLRNVLLSVDEVGLPRSRVFAVGPKPSETVAYFQSWTDLLQHGEEDWIAFNDEKRAKTTVAALFSTSGTTGLPKAAELSHYAFVSQSIMLYDSKEKCYDVS